MKQLLLVSWFLRITKVHFLLISSICVMKRLFNEFHVALTLSSFFLFFFFFTQTNRNNSPKIILSLWLHLSRRNIILSINKHTDSTKSLIVNGAYNYRRLNKYLMFEWKITSPKIDSNKRYGAFKCVICWLAGNVSGTAVLY